MDGSDSVKQETRLSSVDQSNLRRKEIRDSDAANECAGQCDEMDETTVHFATEAKWGTIG